MAAGRGAITYRVKEIFYSLQGEGINTGRPAVFCRFSGCNLWSGREARRAAATCTFCDTDFVGTNGHGGGTYANAGGLAAAVAAVWNSRTRQRSNQFVICTGGEPLLQLDTAATTELHRAGFEIAVETNGTRPLPSGVDWICVSPKGSSDVVITGGDELKLVYPQFDAPPTRFESLDFTHLLLQPMDGPDLIQNTATAVDYCLRNPPWRLSLQTHKLIGIK